MKCKFLLCVLQLRDTHWLCLIQGLHPSKAALVDHLHHSVVTRLPPFQRLPQMQSRNTAFFPRVDPSWPRLSQDSLHARAFIDALKDAAAELRHSYSVFWCKHCMLTHTFILDYAVFLIMILIYLQLPVNISSTFWFPAVQGVFLKVRLWAFPTLASFHSWNDLRTNDCMLHFYQCLCQRRRKCSALLVRHCLMSYF